MKPTVLKWFEYLNCILPIFVDTVELNSLFEKLLGFDETLNFKSLEILHLSNEHIQKMKTQRFHLQYLFIFKEKRWTNIMNKIHEMIQINNEINMNGYTDYNALFLDILDKVVCFFKTNEEITEQTLQPIRRITYNFLHMTKREISRKSLKCAVNNFEMIIPTLVKQINFVALIYLEAKTKEEIEEFSLEIKKLIDLKYQLKEKYTDLSNVIKSFSTGFFNEIKFKQTAANYLYHYFYF